MATYKPIDTLAIRLSCRSKVLTITGFKSDAGAGAAGSEVVHRFRKRQSALPPDGCRHCGASVRA